MEQLFDVFWGMEEQAEIKIIIIIKKIFLNLNMLIFNFINNNNNKVESSFYPDGIKEILDDLFFDSLTLSNSNLFIVNDSINHSIEINNMKIN